jgi:hypothetical protein
MRLLEQAQVWTHAFVVGELACGNLAQRDKVLSALIALPHAPVASHDEALAFLEVHRLMGRGLEVPCSQTAASRWQASPPPNRCRHTTMQRGPTNSVYRTGGGLEGWGRSGFWQKATRFLGSPKPALVPIDCHLSLMGS